MTLQHSEFLVAARGWQHPQWCGNFYPDDLPEDWRLAYYSNEFRAVVVPAARVAVLTADEAERWAEDVHEEFRFYLEVAGDEDAATLAERLGPLNHHLGGILLCLSETDNLSESLLRAVGELAPVCIALPAGREIFAAEQKLLGQLGIGVVWPLAEGEPVWQDDAPLVVARTEAGARTPRQWREVVETCLRFATGKQTLLLEIAGEAPDIEAMRTVSIIAELLTPAVVTGTESRG